MRLQMIKKLRYTIYLGKETKNKLRYVSYRTGNSQTAIVNEALQKHLEKEIELNPGYQEFPE